MDCFEVAARRAQEDASYHAWMARNEINNVQYSVHTVIFFQEESAYFAEIARNILCAD